jgi:hypothetical protein
MILVGACLTASICFAAEAPATTPSNITALIQSLADPDPAARQSAADQLLKIGTPARPELLKAAHSSAPEVASHASEILMKLHWWKISDPPDARRALITYGSLDNEHRADLIDQIAREPGAAPVLLRLAEEDPSDQVGWRAERDLRAIWDEGVNDSLRKMDLTDARPPILALAARAFVGTDHTKASALLHRLIEQDESDPTLDAGELDFAYRLLSADAIEAGDLSAAANLLRQHVRQAADPAQADAATFELFAFYADLGPTAGFDRDVDEFGTSMGNPEVMYAMARIAEHGPDGSPMLGDMLSVAAFSASLASPIGHSEVGETLLDRCWNSRAAREFYGTLALKDEVDPSFSNQIQYIAQHRLAQVNENTENHLLVAEHADRAAELAAQMPDASNVDANATLPEAYWHRLRAARDAHDEKTEQEYLGKLMALPAEDSDASIEVYRTLMSQGKTDQAKKYFETAYDASQKKLELMADDAEELNNIAWLCASCGQRVPEALKYAADAVARQPEVFAFIDTAAAANAAAGNFTEAARLEKRALAMRPADEFMRQQFEKYQKAAAGR